MPQVGRINDSNKTSRGGVSDAAGLAEDNTMTLSRVKANRERRFMNRLLVLAFRNFQNRYASDSDNSQTITNGTPPCHLMNVTDFL